MCIMAASVTAVSGTSILVGRNESGTRQLVVYAMTVETGGQRNAMILPVPAAAASIELIDVSADPKFFDRLRLAFEPVTLGMRGMSKSRSATYVLPVQTVGSYNVSVVPTLDDLQRVDTTVFSLSPDTARLLRGHYSYGYAFVVAQLKQSGAYHPLAYTHDVAASGQLFVPTRHGHGGPEKPTAHFDHRIYVPLALDGAVGLEVRRPLENPTTLTRMRAIDSASAAVPALRPYLPLYLTDWSLLRLTGPLDNTDLWF